MADSAKEAFVSAVLNAATEEMPSTDGHFRGDACVVSGKLHVFDGRKWVPYDEAPMSDIEMRNT